MNIDGKGLAALMLASTFFGFCIGTAGGDAVASKTWQRRAIENGAAYYACEPTTGECVFTWRQK